MVHAIGSSNCSQQLHRAEFVSHSTVSQGLSSASTLRTAAEASKKTKPAPATSGGISGCISKVVTSIKNFFGGIMNWFLGLCGKGSKGSSSQAGKSKLEMFLAALDDKDAKVSAQKKAFAKISEKDLTAVAKQLVTEAKDRNKMRKKAGDLVKQLRSVDDTKVYAQQRCVGAKVRAAVQAVVDARAAAKK